MRGSILLILALAACSGEPPGQAHIAMASEAAAGESETDRLVADVLAEEAAEEAAAMPPLFEGSRYADFTPEQISAFCGEDWETRISASGRTEYNPCHRRDAFR